MTTESTSLAVNQGDAHLSKESLDTTKNQLALLENFVSDVLRPDQDFGRIPGTTGHPTLLKPGAANIIAAFQCHSRIIPETEVLDRAGNFVAYTHKVQIVHNLSEKVVAEGMGGCNTWESKYRYRNALPECPSCGKPNIRQSNRGDGFYCWTKTEGCGAQFSNDHPVANEPSGKTENLDALDLANTIMKMSIKRAEVDAALKLPGVARFFTQDLEDMASAPQQAANSQAASKSTSSATGRGTRRQPAGDRISPAAASDLMQDAAVELENGTKWVMDTIKEKWGLSQPTQLNAVQLAELRATIFGYVGPDASQVAQDMADAEMDDQDETGVAEGQGRMIDDPETGGGEEH